MAIKLGLIVCAVLTILSGIAALWFLFSILLWTLNLAAQPLNALLRMAIWCAAVYLFWYCWHWLYRLDQSLTKNAEKGADQ